MVHLEAPAHWAKFDEHLIIVIIFCLVFCFSIIFYEVRQSMIQSQPFLSITSASPMPNAAKSS